MNSANHRLARDIRKGSFIALLYAVLDPAARTLILSNAAQVEPVLCVPGAPPRYVESEGDRFPLGIVADCRYEETKLDLAAGSTVVFCTDGVVEAMNGAKELYGFERLLACVDSHRSLGAPALLEAIFADVARFVNGEEPNDDMTVIVARLAP
jgi:sigma-B regulation protein RsbU (phosphoserine phosphatase)